MAVAVTSVPQADTGIPTYHQIPETKFERKNILVN
jgi:hypothetical protein